VATPAVTSLPSITASNRAALPPLEIEVVAGDQHRMIQPINPSLKVDLQTGSAPISAPATVPPSQPTSTDGASVATNAGERVRLSADTAEHVARPVEPNYPMLAKQMKVQGSVVLQALIGREGGIQDLRVLSGPAILSTAAMDAVKQWRFRPYFQGGQSVETEARITVNFTISTY
jgi:TonB family protein